MLKSSIFLHVICLCKNRASGTVSKLFSVRYRTSKTLRGSPQRLRSRRVWRSSWPRIDSVLVFFHHSYFNPGGVQCKFRLELAQKLEIVSRSNLGRSFRTSSRGGLPILVKMWSPAREQIAPQGHLGPPNFPRLGARNAPILFARSIALVVGYKSSRGLPVLRLLVWPLGGLKLFWGVNWGALDLENCKSDRGQIFRSDVHLNELVNECLNGFLGQSPFPRWPPKVDPIFLAFSRWRPGGCLSSKIDVFRAYASRMSCLWEHIVEFWKCEQVWKWGAGGWMPQNEVPKNRPRARCSAPSLCRTTKSCKYMYFEVL